MSKIATQHPFITILFSMLPLLQNKNQSVLCPKISRREFLYKNSNYYAPSLNLDACFCLNFQLYHYNIGEVFFLKVLFLDHIHIAITSQAVCPGNMKITFNDKFFSKNS